MNEIISKTYLNVNSPAYLGSQALVYKIAKKINPKLVTYENVRKELAKQRVYGLHKQIKRKFARNRTYAVALDSDWQIDLADLSRISDQNDGFRYLFICVDVLSKYAFVVPMKNKQPTEIINAFKFILETSQRRPWFLYSDRGSEFISAKFRAFVESQDIIQKFASNTETKAAISERYIRSLKEILWKHFTLTQSFKYLKILPTIVCKLNHRVHRSIGMRPVDVTQDNEKSLRKKLYGETILMPIKFKFALNEKVRIGKLKGTFAKGYNPRFTDEIFTIKSRIRRQPPVYKLCDLNDNEIVGAFYENELNSVSTENDIFQVERILKTRTVRGQKQHLVKWAGYSKTQWIPASDLL